MNIKIKFNYFFFTASFQPTSSFEPISDHKYDPHYTYNNNPGLFI